MVGGDRQVLGFLNCARGGAADTGNLGDYLRRAGSFVERSQGTEWFEN